MDKSIELRVKTSVEFSDRYLPVTKPENLLGFLDGDQKILGSWFPSWITGSRRGAGVISANTDTGALIDQVMAMLNTGESPVAKYFVATTNVTVSLGTGTLGETSDWENGEESDSSGSITLENEDVIMVSRVDSSGANPVIYWAVINNTYPDATSTMKGIMKLINNVTTNDSLSAASAAAVKTAYDLAASKDNYGGFKLFVDSIEKESQVGSNQTLNFKSGEGVDITYGEVIAGVHDIQIDVEQASSSNKGIAEIATVSEVKAGVDNSRFVTPATLFDSELPYFADLASANLAAGDYPEGKIVIVEV